MTNPKFLDGDGLNTLWADIEAEIDDQVSAAVAGLYDYKGSVATYADLPSSDVSAGDVYNVQAAYGGSPAGTNWAWTGSSWDALGGSMSNATAAAAGLMSAADKIKLDGIEANANAYELPLMSPDTRGGAKLGDGLAVEDGALLANSYIETRQSGTDTYQVLVAR